ncbi:MULTISPECIES: protein-L-isoaspartate(D-aspartate) O-methyltransferase [unclassified Bradyrhizobium]|uniref:protein-L-isoaspartate(D-aspartate) O-methyltransferase n=1 Tax=unclassified Bradyrhizobium TaxID=2631580 RepID=UPI0003A99DA5|nr:MULTISPECIES: protein-L-isoaspartate(D-aspartate) O-methyltransferase [unclassified Bradyrhizobium]MCK1537503.1 protein-L-isoaspartate(D-aspartate) O-methyltransferase [Bradyrhizobium sp. 176]MCK1554891.1 protein-L-isoaspartate(D-aspartate) O-methyltransferase [Bradyrhizobium sp. 171]MCK1700706.1 protein-L-isoaspartate(D-aspartate) O-methyltransferase [Bradyrhizobium sp. 146]UPK11187.1 protein-L-isoaspartate(D-aspartate) O-methyltransferase [Bradyrhizobium sp. 155]
MAHFAQLRDRMVKVQLAGRGIRDGRVLSAMAQVPRERFVEPGFEEFAYEDGALPIAHAQTVSQPYIVALMTEAAELNPADKVLEIGTGSGYATAVASRLARTVHTIERHGDLASVAADRLSRLGYTNCVVHTADGTRGLPEEAPFDAILVAAGGPAIPEPLKQQLAIGGRLVIPVGDFEHEQSLLRLTRRSDFEYEEEAFGAVRFVPLIGEHGWAEDGTRSASNHVPGQAQFRSLPDMIRAAVDPLPPFDDPAFGEPFDRFASSRIVLLGEASHGTSEFYQARAAITRRLIEKHGFTAVAVEADWPDAAAIDRYVRQRASRSSSGKPFQRFPSWMWRNTDVAAFVEWMREHNDRKPARDRAAFFGLDIYNMRSSIAAVLTYLDRVDPAAAAIARERYGCLTPWQREPSTYGRAVLTEGYRKCEAEVVRQCQEILGKQLDYAANDPDSFLDAAQNARLVASAERYYRIMYYGGAESWNLRDTHMFETLGHILEAQGPQSKAVVWAHNSHIGDARFTEMGVVREELNLGQLCRNKFAGAACLVGFGTHRGTVAAASDWDGEMEVMQVRASRPDSYERQFHDAGVARGLLEFRRDESLRRRLIEPRLERFIGVIYRPDTELQSHYAEASLPQQFDAFLWCDESHAVRPLGPEHCRAGVPDTYPFGL